MEIIRIIAAWFAALPTYWKIEANPHKYGNVRNSLGYKIMSISWGIVSTVIMFLLYLASYN